MPKDTYACKCDRYKVLWENGQQLAGNKRQIDRLSKYHQQFFFVLNKPRWDKMDFSSLSRLFPNAFLSFEAYLRFAEKFSGDMRELAQEESQFSSLTNCSCSSPPRWWSPNDKKVPISFAPSHSWATREWAVLRIDFWKLAFFSPSFGRNLSSVLCSAFHSLIMDIFGSAFGSNKKISRLSLIHSFIHFLRWMPLFYSPPFRVFFILTDRRNRKRQREKKNHRQGKESITKFEGIDHIDRLSG